MFYKTTNCYLRSFLLFFVFCTLLLSYSAAGAEQEETEKLREIENYIEHYYLYLDEDEKLSLNSLNDVEHLLADPYSTFLSYEELETFQEGFGRSFSGVGLMLEMKGSSIVVVSTIPQSPAEEAGIKIGDVIISVNGQSVWGSQMEQVIDKIRGEEGSRVSITILRDGELIDYSLVRKEISLPSVDYNWVDSGIAMIKAYNFDSGTASEISSLIERLEHEGLRGIILDLRGNQGGYVDEVLQVAAFFTDGVLLQVRERGSPWREIQGDENSLYNLPITVLVNKGTASAAEILAAALKDNKAAVLVGEETFGKGTMQALFEISKHGFLKLTTAEFISPAGARIENIGVAPHFLESGEKEKQDLALKIIQHAFVMDEGGTSFIEASLREKREKDKEVSVPREIGGELYFPLRASLLITGRSIHIEQEPYLYYFNWNGGRYIINIENKEITATDVQGNESTWEIILDRGRTYVPAEFLEEALIMPYY